MVRQDRVAYANGGARRRHVGAEVGEEHDLRGGAQQGRLARAVRARDNGAARRRPSDPQVVRLPLLDVKVQRRLAPHNVEDRLHHNVWRAPAQITGHERKRQQHVELSQRAPRREERREGGNGRLDDLLLGQAAEAGELPDRDRSQ